jgi:DNA-binding beta-propeller fold protein YncE
VRLGEPLQGLTLIGLLCCHVSTSQAGSGQPLRLAQSIPLEGVEGRIDHMAVDLQGGRLFVAALGNGSLEVINLRSAKRVRSLRGFREPQGVGFVSSPARLFVANGGDGTCEMLDGTTFERLRTLRLIEDADNVRCDETGRRIYVGCGEGALAVLDSRTGENLGSIPLSAHPESFQLEADGTRAFVNVPALGQVAIVDRAKRHVTAAWKIERYRSNYPMALDDAGNRLFVGCRRPAAVLVLDTRSGRNLGTIPVDGDSDDMFYDAHLERLYVACGAGFVDVIAPTKSGEFIRIARVPTASGARTALFVPDLQRLFVAVPHRGFQHSEIRVFDVAP